MVLPSPGLRYHSDAISALFIPPLNPQQAVGYRVSITLGHPARSYDQRKAKKADLTRIPYVSEPVLMYQYETTSPNINSLAMYMAGH